MNATIIEKIEDYLLGNISMAELQQYAVKQNITNLEEQIAWVRDVAIAVEAQGVKNQIAKLVSDSGEVSKPAKVVSIPLSRWIVGLAASLLLVVVSYYGLQNQSTNNQYKYAQYTYQDPGLPVVMSETSNYALYDALTYYGEKDYTTAIAKLSALPSSTNDTVTYYLGASYHYQDKYQEAIAQLKAVAIDINSTFQQRAQWLLVHSYLRQGSTDEAKVLLSTITSMSQHQFLDQATSLQQEL